MVLLVSIDVIVALAAVLSGARMFRDRHRYGGEPTFETDGHETFHRGGSARGYQPNPALLAEKAKYLGIGFPGGEDAKTDKR